MSNGLCDCRFRLMHPCWRYLLAGLVVLISSVKPTFSEQVAFQNFINESDVSFVENSVGEQDEYNALINTALAQRFHAEASGIVSSISASVRRDGFYSEMPLIVEIRSADHGIPGDVLGSVSTDLLTQSNTPLTNINLQTANVGLETGSEYYVVFRTSEPAPLFWEPQYHVRLMNTNPRSSGFPATWSKTGGTPPWFNALPLYPQEIGLIVNVVPEPPSRLLMICGLALIYIRRWDTLGDANSLRQTLQLGM